MTRREKTFTVWLFNTTANAIVATIERLGGVRSQDDAEWLYPSPIEPHVRFDVRFGDKDDAERLGAGTPIGTFLLESAGPPEFWRNALAERYAISPSEALWKLQRAAAWIDVATEDRTVATEILPRMIQTLLTTHEGVAFCGSRSWTSKDAIAGKVDGMVDWPFPSIEEEYRRSDAVFVGKVVGDSTPMGDGLARRKATSVLSVERVLRGELVGSVEVVRDPVRFPMVVGKKYLIFAADRGGGLTIDPMGNSATLSMATDTLAALQRLAEPTASSSADVHG